MPSQKLLKRLALFVLVLGCLGFAVAAVVWLLQRQFDMTVQIALAFGVLGLAVAALLDPATPLTWLQGRQARYGSNVVLMSLAFAGILGILNYLVINGPVPADWKRKDLTQDQSNTLSAETLAAIKALPGPVKAVGFYTPSAVSQQDSAKRLTWSFRDPVEATVAAEIAREHLRGIGLLAPDATESLLSHHPFSAAPPVLDPDERLHPCIPPVLLVPDLYVSDWN